MELLLIWLLVALDSFCERAGVLVKEGRVAIAA